MTELLEMLKIVFIVMAEGYIAKQKVLGITHPETAEAFRAMEEAAKEYLQEKEQQA